jgi:hypothetical protein
MRLQHVHFQAPPIIGEEPVFMLYKGDGFWDLCIFRHRWRWFW